MATNYAVHTRIRAYDNASPVMRRIADQARRTARSFHGLNAAAGAMRRIGALARPLERGFSFAAASAVAAGGSILLMANQYATARDEQAKFARQIGFSADAMDRLSFITDRQGGNFDTLKSGLQAFTKRMGELRAQTGGLNAMLEKTDPAFAQLLRNTTDNERAFELFLGKVAGLPDEQAKAALAAAGVSRGAMSEIIRLTDGGTKAFQALRAEADKYRAPINSEDLLKAEQYKDAQTNLTFAVRGVADTISSRVIPVLTPFIQRLADWAAANREIIGQRVDELAARFGQMLQSIDLDRIAAAAQRFAEGAARVGRRVLDLIDRFGGFTKVLTRVAIAWAVLKGFSIAGMIVRVGVQVAALIKTLGSIGVASRATSTAVAADMAMIDSRLSASSRLFSRGITLGISTIGAMNALNAMDARVAETATRFEALGLSPVNAQRRALETEQTKNTGAIGSAPIVKQIVRAQVVAHDALQSRGLPSPFNPSLQDRIVSAPQNTVILPNSRPEKVEIELKVRADDSIRVESGHVQRRNRASARSGANLDVGVTMTEGN